MSPTLTWTHTDEAPMLASAAFLPVLQSYLGVAGVNVDVADISLSGRILAAMGLAEDDLSRIGELARSGKANIIKLPNISASVAQMQAAIAELQEQGYDIPDYPLNPSNDEEKAIQERYDVAKGSAVNPVIREGNSDRRAPEPVKEQVKVSPHKLRDFNDNSKTRVLTMSEGDFRHTEQSHTFSNPDSASIVFVPDNGEEKHLREPVKVLEGEILDSAVMRAKELDEFLADAVKTADNEDGAVFSAHLKATMMKVSDPIIFGHVLKNYFSDVMEKYGDQLRSAGWKPDQGLAALEKVASPEVIDAIRERLAGVDGLAMVDSDSGIDGIGVTSLHVSSDIIVDASMPAMIKGGGIMWDKHGERKDTVAVIPDSSYADLYDVVVEDCKKNGAYDPTTMGTVPNVGLMAKKAEEYGSHDKTFLIEGDGKVEVRNQAGDVLMSHEVKEGDIWRACQTKEEPIRDWVRLAARRGRATGWPCVFWLDEDRAHDIEIRKYVDDELSKIDTDGLDIRFMSVREATQFSVDRIRRGENTISVTGNVLRDYLTDLFPILELGTSARMLSIVPLMNGGGLFETGAGGSAPKLAKQVFSENHLRWDSVGEYMALTPSLEQLAADHDNKTIEVMAHKLDEAIKRYLSGGYTPSRKSGEPDNRSASYWVSRFWAEELANQNEDSMLKEKFTPVAEALIENEEKITSKFIEVQGRPVEAGGYYRPDPDKVASIMRPSAVYNEILASI